jgi:hypothetical protein
VHGPRVVVVNGPAGVGKTTVGRLLAARARNGVCIEGDAASRAGRDPLAGRVAACHRTMERHLAGLGEVVPADAGPAEIAELFDRRAREGAPNSTTTRLPRT